MNNSTLNPDASSKKDTENYLEEWKQARDVLKSFDDRVHDLRKYGFSFLTALLTAEAILLPSNHIHDLPKFAVFAVTIVLISALHLLDRNYVAFQEAASTRARELEVKLNLRLSEIISKKYEKARISLHVLVIYSLIIFGVLALGCSVFENKWIFIPLLIIITLAAFVYILYQDKHSES